MPRALLKTGTHGDQWLPTALDGAMIMKYICPSQQHETQKQSSAGNFCGIYRRSYDVHCFIPWNL